MKVLLPAVIIIISLVLTSYPPQRERSSQNQQVANEAQTITIVATGDVMLGRSVNTRSHKYGFQWPFEKVEELLSHADITLSNLESPLGYNCPLRDDGMKFCGDSTFSEYLRQSGIDIVTIANNHGADQGSDGISITQEILSKHDIASIGTEAQPYITTVHGVTFGFLAYNTVPPDNDQLAWGLSSTVTDDITALRSKADVIISSFHWGNEYTHTVSSFQEELAHTAIDAGSDIVIGHHPHWIQRNEIYKGKPIYYSLGNFIFDQMWSQKTREGLVLKITFNKDTISQIEHIPVVIEDYGQPRIANNKESAEIISVTGLISFD